MKRSLLILIAVFFIGIYANAQTILFTDSFETYTTGGFLVQQANPSAWWTTWTNQTNGGTEDAKITEAQAHSPIKAMLIDSDQDDIILKLGNKTSGKFNVSFWYYIPTGFGGYFNLQHYQNPGIQWANEVYFGNDGNGNIEAQGIITNFTHPLDTWMFLETIVDIDLDSAWFYIDGTKIVQWQFSTKADGSAGAAQLGGVDFYGGAITGQTATYYFDDVTFSQLAQPLDPPTINLSTTTINTDGSAPESFTITNAGQEDMNFTAYTTYPYSANNVPAASSPSDLTYATGPLASGIGWTSSFTVKSAAKFTPTKINPSIGQELTSVIVSIWDLPTNTNMTLLVYERGSYNTPGPGNLLASKPFTVSTTQENVTINLDSPIYIDGNDLWVGYECDAVGGSYNVGLDGGPRVPGVNWVSSGPGWNEYSSTVDMNLMIVGMVSGNSIQQWLTVSPTSGTLTPAQTQTMDLTFNTTGLPDGTYHSVVVVGSNDPVNEYSDVDVYLTVVTNIENPDLNIGIMTFPNPATQNVNVKSNQTIDFINVYDINGKLINKVNFNSMAGTVDVSGYAKGNYVMEIHSGSNLVKRNIIVK